MNYIIATLSIIIGYLSGSVNYAILISKILFKKEIREIGNLNAGTMNVFRSIGKKWGILVGVLDALKALIPMIVTGQFLFTQNSPFDIFVILAIGIAGVAGHCWPVFHKFEGGRGVASIIGVYLYFVPVEFVISMILGAIIIALFFKDVEFRWGRWVPIMFITITPFLSIGINFFVNITFFGSVTLGGHSIYELISALIASFFMLFINFTFMGERVDEYKESSEDEE